MHREDDSNFLLYMEPKNPKQDYIDDELTETIKKAFEKSKSGIAYYSNLKDNGEFTEGRGGWRGWHVCGCGECGGNKEYLLENGMITNYLCVHYVAEHRDEIPKSELLKLKKLVEYYKKV